MIRNRYRNPAPRARRTGLRARRKQRDVIPLRAKLRSFESYPRDDVPLPEIHRVHQIARRNPLDNIELIRIRIRRRLDAVHEVRKTAQREILNLVEVRYRTELPAKVRVV